MKTLVRILAVIFSGLLLFVFDAGAKTASCPCSPCKCSPCTCGGGGSKSSSSGGSGKHHDDHHGHGHHDGGSSVGVGVSVDLSGVGHRTREADPFATGGSDKPAAHTEEKHVAKKKEHEPTNANFDEIKLTGQEAKDGSNPPNTFNVNNDEVEQPSLPPKEVFTKEKPKEEKPKQVAKDDLLKAYDNWSKAATKYRDDNWKNNKTKDTTKKILELTDQFNKSDDGKKILAAWKELYDNFVNSGGKVDDTRMIPKPTNEMEKKKYDVAKAQVELDKAWKDYNWARDHAARQDDDVKKAKDAGDFEKKLNDAGAKWAGTDEGKKEIQKVHDAEKELDKAKDAWKPFEKYEEKKEASNR